MTFRPLTKQPAPAYQLIEDPADDIYNVTILDGLAAGFVYRYGRVMFNELEGQLKINFTYDVIYNPGRLTQQQILPIISVILDDILKKEQQAFGPY
jgi:hypothetical protein